MRAWRIVHRNFSQMDGEGSSRHPGRWNGPGQRTIYAGTSFAIAMLERLCYTATGRVPKVDVCLEIDIPDRLIETFDPVAFPGWDRPRSSVARSFGIRWHAQLRSVALRVPSAVTKLDWNLVLNRDHPDFAAVSWAPPWPVRWDARLFLR
jgi:RES domain-containing protein